MRPTPEQIDEIITAAGLTKETAAKALGVAPRTVQEWLCGEHKPNLKHTAGLLGLKSRLARVKRWVYRFVGKGRVERRMVARESVEVRALRAENESLTAKVALLRGQLESARAESEALVNGGWGASTAYAPHAENETFKADMALLRRQLENSQAECHDERCKRLALGDELDKVKREGSND